MRIAIASSGLGHVSRGIETWAEDLGRALASRGEAVRLCKAAGVAELEYERVIPCWTRESSAAARLRRLLPRFLGWRIGLGSGYGVEQASFAVGLLRLLRRERVEILHVQDPLLALIAQEASRLGLIRARTILAHGTEEPSNFQRKICFLQHLAPWHLEQAVAGGFARQTWTAIPNFVDTDAFRPGRGDALRAELAIPPDATVVLSVAAIKRGHKRVDYLIDEFARLIEAEPDLQTYLVVAGGREAETDELIREGLVRLGNRSRFLVRFPRARMPELFRTADLFVLTSLMEMMPIALLEALASGLPCLVHDHPVMKWMVGPGGRAIRMDRPGDLAAEMAGILADRDAREKLGGRAVAHAIAHFGRERVVGQILEYYSTVLNRESLDPLR